MKLPFFQFYPADYQRDTRALSLAAKGGWVDILCMLHSSSTRGSMTLPVVGWARVMGATVDQAAAVISELESMDVADIVHQPNGDVTVESRRMKRDELTREQTRLRVQRHRLKEAESKPIAARNGSRNAQCNGDETGHKAEDRRHNTEDRNNTSHARAELAEPAHAPRAVQPDELALGPVETNPTTDPIAMMFLTVGQLSEWPLRASKVDEWRKAYPGVDIDAELRSLRQWCVDNPRKRKTAAGMLRFLSGCLARKQDRGGGRGNPPTSPKNAPDAASVALGTQQRSSF